VCSPYFRTLSLPPSPALVWPCFGSPADPACTTANPFLWSSICHATIFYFPLIKIKGSFSADPHIPSPDYLVVSPTKRAPPRLP
jgi:hypothetical protein